MLTVNVYLTPINPNKKLNTTRKEFMSDDASKVKL